MKIRSGFVSNSSSSSFICEVCNRTETYMDCYLEDVGMYSCVNGHTFCEEHLLEEIEESWSEELGREGRYDIPEKVCPICNFVEASYKDMAKYLEKTHNIPRADIFAEIKKVNKRRRKLYDNEYVEAVCQKTNQTLDTILVDLKKKYATYSDFLKA